MRRVLVIALLLQELVQLRLDRIENIVICFVILGLELFDRIHERSVAALEHVVFFLKFVHIIFVVEAHGFFLLVCVAELPRGIVAHLVRIDEVGLSFA